jgi:predicted nucleotidyltransferase
MGLTVSSALVGSRALIKGNGQNPHLHLNEVDTSKAGGHHVNATFMAKRRTKMGRACYSPDHGPETPTDPAMRTITEILPHEATSHLAAYKRDVQRALPGVEKMILFGSRARDQAREDSDYDIAVVVRDLSDRRHIRRILSDLAYDHILSGFFIRPIPLPSDYLEPHSRRPTELAEDIVRDGLEIT